MNSHNIAQRLARQYLLIGRMIWGVLVVSTGVYAFVAHSVLGTVGPVTDFGREGSLTTVLTVAALVVAILSIFVRNLFLNRPLPVAPGHLKGLNDQQRQELSAAPIDLRNFVFSYPNWLVAHIVALALSESVVIFGLVAVSTTGEFGQFVPFWLGSLVLMGWHFPRPGSSTGSQRASRT
ncbi:MAG: hypothetical protein IT288_16075 [Bdellovibrionales bacterium]|nr:hypothetical protein [Bdellovibrionales bacterium]